MARIRGLGHYKSKLSMPVGEHLVLDIVGIKLWVMARRRKTLLERPICSLGHKPHGQQQEGFV